MRSLPLVFVVLAGCGVHIDGSRDNAQIKLDAPEAVDGGSGGSAIDAPVLPPDARACTGGDAATSNGTNCFIYVNMLKNWNDAETFCEGQLAAKLAVIKTADENTLIGSMIGTAADPASTVFLGGTDAVTEGTWLWTDTTQFWLGLANGTAKQTFTNWGPKGNPSQPNNGGGKFQEDCLVMRGDSSDTWFDRPCDTEANADSPGTYGFVCEF